MKKLIILTLLSLTNLTFAHSPTSKHCEYYKDVEAYYRCGNKGYPMNIAYKLCQKYLDRTEELSPSNKRWTPKVRYCLQKFVEDNKGSIRDCNDLREKAIDSHVDCFRDTGYCDLALSDHLEIMKITSTDMLTYDILGMGTKISAVCAKRNILK